MAPVTKFGSGYKDQLQIITQEKTLDFGTKDENAFGQELIGTMGDVLNRQVIGHIIVVIVVVQHKLNKIDNTRLLN